MPGLKIKPNTSIPIDTNQSWTSDSLDARQTGLQSKPRPSIVAIPKPPNVRWERIEYFANETTVAGTFHWLSRTKVGGEREDFWRKKMTVKFAAGQCVQDQAFELNE